MPVSYNLILIVISIAVAVVGSHAGFSVMNPTGRFARTEYKTRLLMSAVVFGGSIWAMHFIGMHAIDLPIVINYAILPTFVSALVAILLTGLGLYVATSGIIARHPRKLGALLMGAGITSMHYLGIGAIRANCIVETPFWSGLVALLIGVLASWFALRAISSPRRSESGILFGAVLLGIAMAGMHYSAMADTRFLLGSGVTISAEPVMNEYYLASLAALLAFLLCDLFIFVVLPEPTKTSPFHAPANGEQDRAGGLTPAPHNIDFDRQSLSSEAAAQAEAAHAPNEQRIAIETSSGAQMLSFENILSAKADGHYSEITVYDAKLQRTKTVYASISIAQLHDKLPKEHFARVHRSYIVNLSRVARLDKSAGAGRLHLSVSDSPEIPVSRSYMKIISGKLLAAD